MERRVANPGRMSPASRPRLAFALGAMLVGGIAVLASQKGGPGFVARLDNAAGAAIAGAGAAGRVEAAFVSPMGSPTRHPQLSIAGGGRLDEATRARAARAIAAIPGVGGVRWSDGASTGASAEAPVNPLHCQEDVEALLRARTIRFEEASARIDAASRSLIGEVAQALRPCLGSIIAVTGHTDTSGTEPGNVALSYRRAEAVRRALVAQGIPDDGLRASGVGSREPVEGLEPTDPANRRIEFSVIATEPFTPTPVDTPGPR